MCRVRTGYQDILFPTGQTTTNHPERAPQTTDPIGQRWGLFAHASAERERKHLKGQRRKPGDTLLKSRYLT